MSTSAPPLVEQLVCVGAGTLLEPTAPPPSSSHEHLIEETTFTPSILYTYTYSAPACAEPPSPALPSFCLPSGLRIVRSARPSRFGCFVLTGKDGQRLYGHCLITFERLPSTTRVVWPAAGGGNGSDGVLDGAAADPNKISTIGNILGGSPSYFYAPRCLCLLSRAHHPVALRACLEALQQLAARSAQDAGSPPLALPIEASLTHLVLNVPRALPGGPAVRFNLGNGLPPMHVSCAPTSQLPSTDYALCGLLCRLGPSLLVKLFQYALLELQLVVVCDDDEQRLACCELLLALLHPFEWAHVYVPSIPDELLGLLANPFPCILGLRSSQAAQLPSPLPESMAVLTLPDDHAAAAAQHADTVQLTPPSRSLPSLPARESDHLLAALNATHRAATASASETESAHASAHISAATVTLPPLADPASGGAQHAVDISDPTPAAAAGASTAAFAVPLPAGLSTELLLAATAWEPDDEPTFLPPAGTAAAPYVALEACCRGAFLRFVVSAVRDLHRFLPEGRGVPVSSPPPPSEAHSDDLLMESAERFVAAQPPLSQPFLGEFVRTQLFLNFVEPPLDGGGPGGGSSSSSSSSLSSSSSSAAGGKGARGGRCFQMVRDAFLQRELVRAARRERVHSNQPLPKGAADVADDREDAPSTARRPPPAGHAPAAVADVPAVHEVAPVALADASALLPGGYRYPSGLPASLPPECLAAHRPPPPFDVDLPPTPRVSPAVRAAWAEALAELEKRNESRQSAQAMGLAGGGLMIGGAAAAILCTLQ